MMTIRSYRDTWVEISLDAIHNNVRVFKNYIGTNSKLMAVVKADGYGHGAVEVAKEALASGADYLAVAILDEAIQLREAGIHSPLLVLGYTPLRAIPTAINFDITLTVFTEEIARKIKEVAEEKQKQARVHIKIDSGMNRVGIRTKEDALDLAASLASDFVTLEGIFTHFADADNLDATYTESQFQSFMNIITALEENQIFIPIKHCCNSAATIAHPSMHLDMVRVGVSMYGLYPSEHLKEKITLKQAMSLKTKAVYIKTIDTEQAISYGCTFTTNETSTIATIPLGYADGFSRSLSNRGHVTVHGKQAPIVGRICMDQSMIDVSAIGTVQPDDVFTIFGDPNDGYISMGEVAEQMNTIHYETACLIGKRVPRMYVKDEKNLDAVASHIETSIDLEIYAVNQ